MSLGFGAPQPKKKESAPMPSSKVTLTADGKIPTYRGDVRVSLEDTVEPMVVLLIGPPGIGKSYMACTFPSPAICDTEMKGEKNWRVFYSGRGKGQRVSGNGEVEDYEWTTDGVTPINSRLYHSEEWGDVAAFYDRYIDDQTVRTLVFDSETDLREMAELWTLQETGKKTLYGGDAGGAKPYAQVFGKLKYILLNSKRRGKHLVYTAKEKPVYDRAGNKTEEMAHDGYSKQGFYSGYVIHMQLGITDSNGKLWYPKHVFGRVLKAENMRPGFYPPYLMDCSFRGIVNELIRGKEWDRGTDDYLREVITPKMKELGEPVE